MQRVAMTRYIDVKLDLAEVHLRAVSQMDGFQSVRFGARKRKGERLTRAANWLFQTQEAEFFAVYKIA